MLNLDQKLRAYVFGGYHVALYSGAVTVTSENGHAETVTGATASDLAAEFETARDDIATGGYATRFARIGERAAANEIFGDLFSGEMQ